MSLTNSSAIRSVKAQSTLPQASDGVSSVTRPETILEMTDRLCEAILGHTDYQLVATMNSVAEQLSNLGMAKACENLELSTAMLIAACEIGRAADKLDRYLIEQMVARFELEAQI